MRQIHLCFVWHMHQPFYKDLVTGEYHLPWTRLHALKDYYGMVKILDEFPEIRQTFNLVPSMLVQIEEYAAGKAADPFLRCALKPAGDLTPAEQSFMLQYFFQASERTIHRFPRYAELQFARRPFTHQQLRDLQVLSQIAWFDEEVLASDPDILDLVRKGRDFSLEDQRLAAEKQSELLRRVIPVYREFSASGQIEISATPFYHPILPLLCDSDIAGVSHPHVPLPPRFRYPEDARYQLESTRAYMADRFGRAPAGLWPSEGSVSDQVLGLAADTGFRWAASDNGVLARTLQRDAIPEVTYRPYLWTQGGRQIHAIFRDHFLSDLIGFVYQGMDARDAAAHFLHQIRINSPAHRDVLVPIILDGENAWEYYPESGRPFLRALYRMISEDQQLSAVTVSEGLELVDSAPLDHIFPGSWINANFDVWIGAEEDNEAWAQLLRARQEFERVLESGSIAEENRKIAYEELLIAEGSDWCWWYGPEHGSANRPEFDQLFRDHLANVYRALMLPIPQELSRPILRDVPEKAMLAGSAPTAYIQPVINGNVDSYFEWLGAGEYSPDYRSGAMHGGTQPVRSLFYGSNGKNLYVRLDVEDTSNLYEVRVITARHTITLEARDPRMAQQETLEAAIALSELGLSGGDPVRFQISLWNNGLPVTTLPRQGWIEFSTADPQNS